ncbi:MAG: NAD(P)-dependent oxidoreductase [Sphaerochaetaceae bacterium]
MASNVRKPVIGWIGTGVMGRWMCHYAMPLARETVVCNRTPSKLKPLLDEGACEASSPAEVAQRADIVFSIVGYPKDVEEVYFGKEGVFAGASAGKIFVDMTTTKPSLAVQINARAKELGCDSIDAPVSGGDIGAREARLSIMAGGDRHVFDSILPFFSAMGKTIALQGGPGSGQHTKMCNQIVIAGTMVGVCESLLYARKAGLDVPEMVRTISKGAAGCWTLDNLAPRVLKNDYNPGFLIDHFVKDMGIALEESQHMGVFLPGLALVRQLYIAMQGAGQGNLGTQALILALDRISGNSLFSNT